MLNDYDKYRKMKIDKDGRLTYGITHRRRFDDSKWDRIIWNIFTFGIYGAVTYFLDSPEVYRGHLRDSSYLICSLRGLKRLYPHMLAYAELY